MAPWRASIILVPVASAILIGWLLERLPRWLADHRLRVGLATVLLGWAAWAVADGLAIKWRDHSTPSLPDYAGFARADFQPGDVYLTPPDMAEFRLQAMVPQFVTRKTHPYLDIEVIEWDRRLRLTEAVFPRGKSLDCAAFDRLLESDRISHVLVENDRVPEPVCSRLTPVFDGDTHRVYLVETAG